MRNTRGFALPFTLFLVTFITLVLAAAFARTTAEHLVAQSTKDQVTALSIAQTGLNAFFSDNMTTRPVPGDSVRYNVVGGYAWVYTDVIQMPADTVANPIVYVVQSVGYVIHPNQGLTPQAERAVAQFAEWQGATMPMVAAFTGASGVDFDVGAGTVAVYGASAASCTTVDTLPFVRTGVGGVFGTPDDTSGFTRWDFGTDSMTAAATQIDWATLNGGSFPTDYNSVQWSDSSYSSQQVAASLDVSGTLWGTGLLIVPGRLRVMDHSDFRWHGVILVGEDAEFHGHQANTRIYGTIITGLDEVLAQARPGSEAGSNDDSFLLQYDPCEINTAMARYTGFRRVDRTWVDNWATY